MVVKRCQYCGREGSRLIPILNRWVDRIDGWKCAHVTACIKRQEQLGEWHGKRVLYRQDKDGTRWTIRKSQRHLLFPYILTCEYRQHRVTSQHASIEAAKAHCEDLTRSLEANSMRDYAGNR